MIFNDFSLFLNLMCIKRTFSTNCEELLKCQNLVIIS